MPLMRAATGVDLLGTLQRRMTASSPPAMIASVPVTAYMATIVKAAVLLAVLPDAGSQASLPDCKDYQTYRPILQAALPLIQKIPIIGSKIATALSFLMALADGVCNVSPPLVTPGSDTIKIEKSGENELRVTLPQGSTINSDNISEADLYFALSRDLLKGPARPIMRGCIIEW